MKKVILVAARKGDIKILRCLFEDNDNIRIVLSIRNQAVDEGLTSVFEVTLLLYTMSTRVIFLSYL